HSLTVLTSAVEYTGHHRGLHSFPTRRSSDLTAEGKPGRGDAAARALARGVRRRRRAARPDVRLRYVADRRRADGRRRGARPAPRDRKSTRLNSSHVKISYAVFCLKKKKA